MTGKFESIYIVL